MSIPALINFGRVFILAFLSFFLGSLAELPAEDQIGEERVLYINSYHPGYQWGDQLFEHFRSAVDRDVELYVEYMDTKRFPGFDQAGEFLAYLETKYRSIRFDAIVAAEDAAYQLLLRTDSPLLEDTPVVFCGVSEFKPSQLWLKPNITGVVQNIAIEETMSLVLRLHPDAPAIVVLTDNTLNGRAHVERVGRFAANRGVEERIIYPNETNSATLKSISRLLRDVPKKSVIYFLSFDVEATGTAVSPDQVFDVLDERDDLPVYVSSTTYLAAGGIGGKLVTAERQGREAADLAAEVLGGANPREVPVVNWDTAQYIFDAQELQEHRILTGELPRGSVIRNTLLDRLVGSRDAIIALGSMIIALVVTLTALLIVYRVRSRNTRTIAYERRLFRTLMDQVPILIYFKDLDGRFVRVNPGYAAYANYNDTASLVGKRDEDLYPKEFAAAQREIERQIELTGEGVVDNLEEHRKPDGSSRWFLATKMPWIAPDGSIEGIVGISQDVTTEIETNRALQRALREREVLLREVHHRTKNNLQLVVSMLNLQRNVLETDSAKEALEEANNRVHSMAMLHEHLYKSPDVAQLKLGEYLEAILSHTVGLSRSDLEVTGEVETEHCLVDLERGVHIGLIVNELVTNAVKHAFPGRRKGTIRLTVRNGDNGVSISITDDGIGVGRTVEQSDHASMGMQIVRALTEQIGGRLELSEREGAAWTLFVPDAEATPSLL